MKVSLKKCARCGEDHDEIEFRAFTKAPGEWTHFATCPAAHEPVLMRIVTDDESQ